MQYSLDIILHILPYIFTIDIPNLANGDGVRMVIESEDSEQFRPYELRVIVHNTYVPLLLVQFAKYNILLEGAAIPYLLRTISK